MSETFGPKYSPDLTVGVGGFPKFVNMGRGVKIK